MNQDGHVRVLPLHVANKIAAGEVVERPASVVKELVENAIDAGAKSVRITVTQGGRKLVSVQDDGCGMSRDDAVLSLERQATSKIRDVEDIERIDTLGFRGEAIPSIASVSRLSITTRRHDSDEGTLVVVNAGTLAEVRAAGCPPGTLVEVRDLFCNVPARRKFLRSYATEESHVKSVFTVHALAHPSVAFSLVVDGRELYRLAPTTNLADRVRDIFGPEFLESLITLPSTSNLQPSTSSIHISGFIERPNLFTPTRREQFVFVNGRPATASSVAYALREAYPRRAGDMRPATILFIDLPPSQVDVNVHPTKREVRFRDNVAVKSAIMAAIDAGLAGGGSESGREGEDAREREFEDMRQETRDMNGDVRQETQDLSSPVSCLTSSPSASPVSCLTSSPPPPTPTPTPTPLTPAPVQSEIRLEVSADGERAKPWQWFKVLAQSASGYLLVETDAGIVTINPIAARERITYEKLIDATRPADDLPRTGRALAPRPAAPLSQSLLIPETVRLSPVDFARITASLEVVRAMGFQLEEFGTNVFKIDAVPQILGSLSPSAVLSTIANDLSESGARRNGTRWREELIAKSIARSFAGAPMKLTDEGAAELVEELCRTRMPYVCPRGKPVMIFTSTRELDRKFDRV